MPARFWRRWRWVSLGLIFAPWWVPNVPPVKPWLERQLSARTGWQCRVGYVLPLGLKGSPVLGHLQLTRPGAQLSWRKVTVRPRWSALWKKPLVLEEVQLEEGDLLLTPAAAPGTPDTAEDEAAAPQLPLLLSTKPLAPSAEAAVPNVAVTPTAVLQEETEPPPGVGLLSSLSDKGTEINPSASSPPEQATPEETPSETPAPLPETAEETAAPSQAPTPETPAATAPAPPPTSAPLVLPPRRWRVETLRVETLTVRDLTIRLRGAAEAVSDTAALQLASIYLPLGQERAEGEIILASWRVLGQSWEKTQALPVTGENGTLRVPDTPIAVPGGTVTVSLQAEPLNPGAPFLAMVQSQELHLPALGQWLLPSLATETEASPWPDTHFRMLLQAGGFLRWPGRSLQTRGLVEMPATTLPLAAWLRAAGWAQAASMLAEPAMPASGARLAFRSLGGTLALDELSLHAQDLLVQGRGTVTTNTGWALATRVYVRESSADLLAQTTRNWPPERQLRLSALANSPWFFLDLPVQGDLLHPTVALWDQQWSLPALRAELARLRALPFPPAGE